MFNGVILMHNLKLQTEAAIKLLNLKNEAFQLLPIQRYFQFTLQCHKQ